MELFDLNNKVAIVTGGGYGLGHGYAVNLAKAGATVCVFGRSASSLQNTVSDIEKLGKKAYAYVGDITRIGDISDTVKKIYDKFGHIDILVNNAGTEIAEPFLSVTEEHFDAIMNVNIKGTYMMAKEVASYMVNQNSGKIINIASLGSYIGLEDSTVYCSSKGAVMQFTKAIAIELAKNNIQVNAIAPGYFLTEMTKPFFDDEQHSKWIKDRIPLGYVGTEDELAGTVIFLASKASDYITGQTILVDGGWMAG